MNIIAFWKPQSYYIGNVLVMICVLNSKMTLIFWVRAEVITMGVLFVAMLSFFATLIVQFLFLFVFHGIYMLLIRFYNEIEKIHVRKMHPLESIVNNLGGCIQVSILSYTN